MNKIFTLIILSVSVYANAQVICETIDEGGVITLTAPAGNVFISIEFASYGTPDGVCGSFTLGACHEPNSQSICEAVFLGQNSASIDATNGIFGDPCGGTFKRLYIQATYASTLPLTLISFTAKKIEASKVRLDWLSDHEINTSHFLIERSTDGVLFEATGSVTATGSGRGIYSFTNIISTIVPTYYYRLKMVDRDNKYQYSNIVLINNNFPGEKLSIFPNPANELITIISNKQQEAFITNTSGQRIKKISLINGNQTVNIAAWNPGIYIIKTEEGFMKFIKM